MSNTSIELFDISKARKILVNWELLKTRNLIEDSEYEQETYSYLRNYVNTSEYYGGVPIMHKIKITYDYSEFHKSDKKGRLYAVYGKGLQMMLRKIRNTINRDIYNDFDIVNAHPTILKQYCDRNRIPNKYLTELVNNREQIFEQIIKSSENIKTREQVKKSILQTMNGGQYNVEGEWYEGFKQEIQQIHKKISEKVENLALLARLEEFNKSKGKSNENLRGKLMNHIICEIENNILMKMKEFMEQIGINTENIILAFDGFEMLKSTLKPTSVFLENMQDYVKEQLNYEIKIINKEKVDYIDLSEIPEVPEMETGNIDHNMLLKMVKIVKKKKEDGKEEEKTILDENKILQYLNKYLGILKSSQPPQLIEITDKQDNGYMIRKLTTFVQLNAPIYQQFEIWNKSADRRTYEKITFIPYLKELPKIDKDTFNCFRGYVHKYEPNFKVDMSKIEHMYEIITELWSGGDKKVAEYILDWFAHKLQKPAKKMSTALVLKSYLQGAGKNTFFGFFKNHVIGAKYAIELSDVEALFKSFNAEFRNTILVLGDEVGSNGDMVRKSDRVKTVISRTSQNTENKGQDVEGNVADYNDYILFSNNDYIVRAEASDRRFMCSNVSNKRVGDVEFWDNAYKEMNDESGKHFFHYLANRDISKFNPVNMPTTEWKRELKMISLDPIMLSIIKLIQKRFVKGKISSDGEFIRDINGNIVTSWIETETRFQTQEFYNEYKNIEQKREEMPINKYSARLSAILCIEQLPSPFDKTDLLGNKMTKKRGFEITLEGLKKKMRHIFKDEGMTFIPNEEEEEGTNEPSINNSILLLEK